MSLLDDPGVQYVKVNGKVVWQKPRGGVMDGVKPVAWVERTENGSKLTRMWSSDLSTWTQRPANPEPLYDQQAIDTLRADYARAEELALQAIEARKEAEAEADALRKDAERYRWLRDGKNDEAISGMIRIYNYGDEAYLLDGGELDAQIDAAKQAAE